jgi:hypothetical protein
MKEARLKINLEQKSHVRLKKEDCGNGVNREEVIGRRLRRSVERLSVLKCGEFRENRRLLLLLRLNNVSHKSLSHLSKVSTFVGIVRNFPL